MRSQAGHSGPDTTLVHTVAQLNNGRILELDVGNIARSGLSHDAVGARPKKFVLPDFVQLGNDGLEVHFFLTAQGFHNLHGGLHSPAAGPLLLIVKYYVLHPFFPRRVAFSPIHRHSGLPLQLQRHMLDNVTQRLAIVQLLHAQRRVFGSLLAAHAARLHLPNLGKQLHQPPGKARHGIRPFTGKFLQINFGNDELVVLNRPVARPAHGAEVNNFHEGKKVLREMGWPEV